MAGVLDYDIKYLPGVGERRAALLVSELNVRTFGDLLYYFPFRYIDRTRLFRIGEIGGEVPAYIQIRARITGMAYEGEGRKRRLRVFASDGTGTADLVWFSGTKWIEKRLEVGREYIIFGRPNLYHGELSFVHPEIDLVEKLINRPSGGLQGVYSSTEKLNNAQLGTKGIYNLVCTLWQQVADHIPETLPESFVAAYDLLPRREALYNIHFPQSPDLLKRAEYRLKFEELLGIQLAILSRRATRTTAADGFYFPRVGEYFNTFYREKLPFELTGAQKRVIREIRADTVTGHQMNRLLQGDVGSGKTLVALMAMLLAADNGFQSCLMVPTEILARQHYASIERMIDGLGIRAAVLTGSTRKRERDEILEALARGEIHMLIGTHALLEERVQFDNLGLVVIDEQHRFGVEQRARMWTKNSRPPHILVMTATPIPRTLAMTLYGDLDVSVIDELPPGRKPIVTRHLYDSQRMKLFGFLRREIARGRQVYVVYPLIKESEKMDYKDLYDGFETLSREFPLPEYRLSVVHGKLPPEEKNEGMRAFKEGETQIMVATSVIEVGVDVPNATVMVIESAERFGLSQLHQLRGRVGRGGEQSYCILMSGDKLSREARARLDAMVETTDGFRLSELDLKLRGAGDINGTQQSGMAFDLKIASLARDGAIVEYARRTAEALLEQDPTLARPEHVLLARLRSRYVNRGEVDFGMIS
ncbi:MAG TPA: ATP-dependent DNA helicase RecG [Candidatus Tidjanibacter faecipullorum]|uniref:ATP-dependent DNA helicase RecG n=1 Tax=Candidatus Tidjanibacter faecipullorum TaxID=2838766 RepID=A0A9D2DF79_9BACT|nr:ATP-dependent DNA helicase RecG [Candidatus Tidjanibacter faecipullorum]